ncbi:MAG: hypothetical protein GF355_11270 [Candidatus Eisenbacteria bacterium]|nr:hypothetical protein [Candidatus Eisenbacteria bacterium]
MSGTGRSPRSGVIGLLTALAATALLTPADAGAESIFAREGLGEWLEPYDLRAQGMGGVAIGVADSFPHSQHNPAAYAFARRATGYVSLYPESRWIRPPAGAARCPDAAGCPTGDDAVRQNSGRLGAVHGVIFLNPSLGLSFGLRQIHDPRYQITNVVEVEDDVSAVRREEGSGGVMAYALGLALKVRRGTAFGFEVSHISGSMRDLVTYDFPRTSPYTDTRDEIKTRIRNGWRISVGGLWRTGRLSVGSFYATPAAADGRRIWRNTLGLQESEDFDPELPASAGAGAAWDFGDRWRAGTDIVWRGWSQADFPGRSGPDPEYSDTWRVGFGVERIGWVNPRARFGEGISWRAGFSHTPWYIEDAAGNRLREIAISAGMGLPVAKDRGRLDLLVRLGRRSIPVEGSRDRPDEIFLQFGLGLTYGSMARGY